MEIRMSRKERDGLKLTGALVERRIRQGQAAQLLGVSVRQVRRMVSRYLLQGDAGLVHCSRGRPSNRKIPEAMRKRAMERLRRQYADFGPTLACEKLAERDGIRLSVETVRQWMMEAGLGNARRSRVRHRQWRQRKPCFGELVQMDTSIHSWFEGRSVEEPVLIAMVDDATSRLLARFFPTDSTMTNMRLLRDYIRRWGGPVALYADQASHFKSAEKRTIDDQLAGRYASWASTTSRPTLPKPRAGWSGFSASCRMAWSRISACAIYPPSRPPTTTCKGNSYLCGTTVSQ